MVMSLANMVVIAVMGFIVLRRGPDRRVGTVRSARWLRIAALVPLGFPVAINLIFGIGEVASGDLGGGGHLLQAAMTMLLGVLVWMRPLQGGVALIAAATIFAAGMFATAPSRGFDAISSALTIVALPQIISGVLFFIAGMLARSATTPGAT